MFPNQRTGEGEGGGSANDVNRLHGVVRCSAAESGPLITGTTTGDGRGGGRGALSHLAVPPVASPCMFRDPATRALQPPALPKIPPACAANPQQASCRSARLAAQQYAAVTQRGYPSRGLLQHPDAYIFWQPRCPIKRVGVAHVSCPYCITLHKGTEVHLSR